MISVFFLFCFIIFCGRFILLLLLAQRIEV